MEGNDVSLVKKMFVLGFGWVCCFNFAQEAWKFKTQQRMAFRMIHG